MSRRKPFDPGTLPVPDRKRKRTSWFGPITRFWFRTHDGDVIRWLQVSRYDACQFGGEPREFVFRIPAHDPRPRGIELGRRVAWDSNYRERQASLYRSINYCEWTEIVYERRPLAQRVRRCRRCGCTDTDCRECVRRTGEPCHWVASDLCSACTGPATLFLPERAEARYP